MNNEDLEFLADILEKSHWLFYGELDVHLNDFAKKVFEREFQNYGFHDVKMTHEFATAYWLFLSELVALDLAEYGTSPRGAWLTERGERFKRLVLGNSNAISEACDFLMNKFNP